MNKYTLNEVLLQCTESLNKKLPKEKRVDLEVKGKKGDAYQIEVKNASHSRNYNAFYKALMTSQNCKFTLNKISYSNDYNLLISNHLTQSIIEEAVNSNIEFLDMAGNAHLEIEDSFYFLSGNKLNDSIQTTKNRTEIHFAWQKVIFYLLNFPKGFNLSLRSLAEHAGVSHSSIQQLEIFLKEREFLLFSDPQKTLTRKRELFDLWIENYQSKLVNKTSFGKFRIQHKKLPEMVNNNGTDFLISGGSSLTIFDNQIGNNEFILYSSDPDNIIDLLSLTRDPEGNIEIRDRFWKDIDRINPYGLAPIILLVSDLMSSKIEKARQLGTQFLEFYLYKELEKDEYSLQNIIKYFKELV